jgi:hypothetical protein
MSKKGIPSPAARQRTHGYGLRDRNVKRAGSAEVGEALCSDDDLEIRWVEGDKGEEDDE